MQASRATGSAASLFSRLTRTIGALDLLHDEATWWIAPGKPGQQPAAGEHDNVDREAPPPDGGAAAGRAPHDREELARRGGSRRALEVESRGALGNGRVYEQQYHFLLTIRDGKIASQ